MHVGTILGMHLRKCALFVALQASMAFGQSVNITGQWATAAGGLYTFDERGAGRINVVPGTYQKPTGYGWLQRTGDQSVLEGEAVTFGCWFQMSLRESNDGTILSGTLRINAKKSTRSCRSSLTKEGKPGAPSPITLFRRSALSEQ